MVCALRCKHNFESLFDQLRHGLKLYTATTKALLRVSVQYGLKCYTSKAEINQAYLKSTNVVIFFMRILRQYILINSFYYF